MRHLNKVTHNLYTYSESLSIHIFQQNECKHRIYPISISCKCLSKFQYFGYPHIPTVLLYKMHVCISRICNDVVTGRGWGYSHFITSLSNFFVDFCSALRLLDSWGRGETLCAALPYFSVLKKKDYTPPYQPTTSFNIQSYDELFYFFLFLLL